MNALALSFALAAPSAPAAAPVVLARVKATTPGSTLAGTARFEQTPSGVKLSLRLAGVPPGEHGVHVHEKGSCERGGEAAGAHYNPLGAPHGVVMKDGPKRAHAGDLGNLVADAEGNAALDALLPGLTLTGGKHNLSGRALIVHEKRDDLSQPAGNAGGRIGCGVIEAGGR